MVDKQLKREGGAQQARGSEQQGKSPPRKGARDMVSVAGPLVIGHSTVTEGRGK